MSCRLSGVRRTCDGKLLRRTVVAHGAVAFLFGIVAILALFVNLGASLFETH
jgi:uncharacterized membrane protein